MTPDAPTALTPRRMRRLATLLAVNAGLVAAVVWQATAGSARAGASQPDARPDRRSAGQYTVVSGAYLGGEAEAIYVLDAANRELAALVYDPPSRTIRLAGYRELVRDANERPGR